MPSLDLTAAVPDTSKPLHLRGLEADLDIYRDRYGIPHVKAQTSHDAFFGQGFATAQDRLWQMDYDRVRAYGRSAEYMGAETLGEDTKMRRFQIARSVQVDYLALDPEMRAMLEAYAAGVNAFIETAAALPVEYALVGRQPEHWQPWDCLAVYKVRYSAECVFEHKLWRVRLVTELGPEWAARLFPGYEPGYPIVVPPGAVYDGPGLAGLAELSQGAGAVSRLSGIEAGSNNWALSGQKTRSGKPLLAGDSHWPLDVPNVYYQTHIACPEFDAIGLTFPGVPGLPNFGHNAYVAWCMTHGMGDDQDLYLERFSRDDPTLYEHNGGWLRAELRRETIGVRGGSAVELDISLTRHGPLIAGNPSKGYGVALQQTATEGPNTGIATARNMLGAKSADELEESMSAWVAPLQNIVYADVDGNIGYLLRGKIPIRPETNAWLPVPGWTGEYDWHGFVPFEEMPRCRNPSTSYIATANNKIAGDDFPYYISLHFAPGFRARRLSERLNTMRDATIDDMKAVLRDIVSIPATVYQRVLAATQAEDEYASAAKEALLSWDGSMERDEAPPAIYRAFRRNIDRMLLRHLLGPLAEEALASTSGGAAAHVRRLSAHFVHMAAENDTSLLPPGSDWESLAAQALAEGLADLRRELGDDVSSWRWRAVHVMRPRHPLSPANPDLASRLDPPSVPMPGDADTVLVSSCLGPDPSTVTYVSAARYVFDTSDWDNSAWVVPFGSSGHPSSSHYRDQASFWAGLELVPMLFSWDRIAVEAESQQTLTPARRP
jgi:penicillin amidase